MSPEPPRPTPRARWIADGGERIFTLPVPAGEPVPRGTVVIVPPFGKRVSDTFPIAHVLQANGFDVVRFDARAHVGRSSGEIEDYTLGSLERDLALVLEHTELAPGPVILVGISLSAPVALRRTARDAGVSGLVTMVGVVDVADTIERASGDSVVPYRRGDVTAKRFQEILGYRVDAPRFVADMDASGYGDLEATLADAAAVGVPVHVIAAGDDELVQLEQVERVAAALGAEASLTVLAGSSHEVSRSVAATIEGLRALARGCLRIAGAAQAHPMLPALTTLIEASGREQAYLGALDGGVRERLAA